MFQIITSDFARICTALARAVTTHRPRSCGSKSAAAFGLALICSLNGSVHATPADMPGAGWALAAHGAYQGWKEHDGFWGSTGGAIMGAIF